MFRLEFHFSQHNCGLLDCFYFFGNSYKSLLKKLKSKPALKWYVNVKSHTSIKLKKQLICQSYNKYSTKKKNGNGGGGVSRPFTTDRISFFGVSIGYTVYTSFTHFSAEFCSRFKLVLINQLAFIYRMYHLFWIQTSIRVLKMQRQILESFPR